MLVDNLDGQVWDGFVSAMKSKCNTDVRALLKNATKFGQPVDLHWGVRIKKSVKADFRDLLEKQHEKFEKFGRVDKITVSQLRVMITKFVAKAWINVSGDRTAMRRTFEKPGLSLAIDGSQDHKMKFDDVDKIVME